MSQVLIVTHICPCALSAWATIAIKICHLQALKLGLFDKSGFFALIRRQRFFSPFAAMVRQINSEYLRRNTTRPNLDFYFRKKQYRKHIKNIKVKVTKRETLPIPGNLVTTWNSKPLSKTYRKLPLYLLYWTDMWVASVAQSVSGLSKIWSLWVQIKPILASSLARRAVSNLRLVIGFLPIWCWPPSYK